MRKRAGKMALKSISTSLYLSLEYGSLSCESFTNKSTNADSFLVVARAFLCTVYVSSKRSWGLNYI